MDPSENQKHRSTSFFFAEYTLKVRLPKVQKFNSKIRQKDILQGKNAQEKNFKCVYLSFFIISKLFLKSEFRAPGDDESRLKIFLAKLFLQDVPMPYVSLLNPIQNIVGLTFFIYG